MAREKFYEVNVSEKETDRLDRIKRIIDCGGWSKRIRDLEMIAYCEYSDPYDSDYDEYTILVRGWTTPYYWRKFEDLVLNSNSPW